MLLLLLLLRLLLLLLLAGTEAVNPHALMMRGDSPNCYTLTLLDEMQKCRSFVVYKSQFIYKKQ